MRSFGGLATACASLLFFAVSPASAGPAVVISRDALMLVTEQANACPPDKVIFITRDTRVVAACDMPAVSNVDAETTLSAGLDGLAANSGIQPDSADTAGAVPAGSGVFLPVPVVIPTWRIDAGADIRQAVTSWLPSDWTLAWDTPAAPAANAQFQYDGEPMAAIAQLFDRLSVWPEAPLTACSFPNERILQVRSSGACGSP